MPMSQSPRQQIEALLDTLPREEQSRLIEDIADRLRQTETRQPPSLYGIWKGKVPEDLDLDQALKEIRSEWLEELEEMDS
jgi:hypothetical protein